MQVQCSAFKCKLSMHPRVRVQPTPKKLKTKSFQCFIQNTVRNYVKFNPYFNPTSWYADNCGVRFLFISFSPVMRCIRLYVFILLLTVENHQVSLATPGDFLHIHSVSRESQRVTTTHVLKLHATTD